MCPCYKFNETTAMTFPSFIAGRSRHLLRSHDLYARGKSEKSQKSEKSELHKEAAPCLKHAPSMLLYQQCARPCLPFARPCAIYEANRFMLFASLARLREECWFLRYIPLGNLTYIIIRMRADYARKLWRKLELVHMIQFFDRFDSFTESV